MLETPWPEDTSEDPADDEAPLKPHGGAAHAPQHGVPRCQQENGPATRDSPESLVTTSIGPVVLKPGRYK